MPTPSHKTLAALLACALLGACAGDRAGTEADPLLAPPTVEAPPPEAPEPVVNRQLGGVETHWWVIEDRGDALANIFEQVGAQPAPMPVEVRERWDDAGLRALTLRADRLNALRVAGVERSAPKRRWLGATAQWDEIARGRRIPGGVRIAGESSGILRLLGRAWTTLAPEGRRIRADFVPQIQPRSLDLAEFDAPGLTPTQLQGPLLRDLLWSVELAPGEMLVILGALPGDADRSRALGPSAPGAPRVGELLLAASASERGGPPVRSIVAIVPRLAERDR
ncbi:MAG: hypothetical protein AAGD00_01350 [Planctomycetota bacterium]